MATGQGESPHQCCCHDVLSVRTHRVPFPWADHCKHAEDWPLGRPPSAVPLPVCNVLGASITGSSSTAWSGPRLDTAATVFFLLPFLRMQMAVFMRVECRFLYSLFISLSSLPKSNQGCRERKLACDLEHSQKVY